MQFLLLMMKSSTLQLKIDHHLALTSICYSMAHFMDIMLALELITMLLRLF